MTLGDEPLYLHVARVMSGRIDSGQLAGGSSMPSERELAEDFGVSRMTARKAFDVLVDLGVVERRERVGAFVARPKLTFDVTSTAGMHEQLRRAGVRPGAVVKEARELLAGELSPLVAEALQTAQDEPVYRIVRVRTADDEPVALEESYFPVARFPGLLEYDLSKSLYGVMREQFGVQIGESVQEVEVATLSPDLAKVFGISPSTSAIHVRRQSRDMDGREVEYARDVYRGDRLRLRASSPGGIWSLEAEKPPPGVWGGSGGGSSAS